MDIDINSIDLDVGKHCYDYSKKTTIEHFDFWYGYFDKGQSVFHRYYFVAYITFVLEDIF